MAALEGTAYLGIGIKGGFYERTDQGAWFLRTDFGRRPTPCPLDQTWPAAISVRDALKRRLDLSIFVVAILILPDMAGAPPIDQVAVNGKVSVLWGTENLVERMAETAKTKTINCPPTPVKSPGSWSSSCPGLAWLRSPSDPAAMEIAGRQMIIHHVDTVNVYTAGGEPVAGKPVAALALFL